MILVLIIIVILVLIWQRARTSNTDTIRREAEELRNGSAGTFDAAAAAALERLDNIENPTARDRFNRAAIVDQNVMQSDVNDYIADPVDLQRRVAAEYGRALDNMEPDMDAIFMINYIENFNDRAHDPQLANTLATTVPGIHSESIERRKLVPAANKREAITNYLENSINYTSDPQNVHDSSINSDLRATLRKLRASSPNADPHTAIYEVRNYIDANVTGPKRHRAERTLNIIEKGHKIGTFDDTEDGILSVVWERAKDKRNSANEVAMKDAIVTALADSVENGSPVCINGRCARVLNSLVTLDFDPNVGSAMTLEAYRNQIFKETQDIIKNHIDTATKSTDPAIRAVAESYNSSIVNSSTVSATQSETFQRAEEQFQNNVKKAIDVNISTYINKLAPRDLERITRECHAAV